MSAPQQPPAAGGAAPYQPPSGAWSVPGSAGAWSPQPAPWPAPGAWGQVTAAPVAPGRVGRQGVLLVLAGAAVGAVVAALVVTLVLVSGARELAREAGTAAGDSLAAALSEQGGPYAGGYEDEAGGLLGGFGMPPVEESPAVEPGVLGPDPVLDVYAQECFGGDLQSCDDLYYEAAPLSGYEEYGGTCGGRVKIGSVLACTELD